jgi:hypothetical protein
MHRHARRSAERLLRRRPYDPRRISRSLARRSTASRWSISTTPPRRRSRRRCSTASRDAYTRNIPTCIAACITSPMPRPRPMRRRAKASARLPQRPSATRRSSSPAMRPRRSTSSPPARRRALMIQEGDEIVSRSWSTIPTSCPGISWRERQGAVIKWAPVDDDGNFLIEEFEKLLTPRTKMVALTHMSNALGTDRSRSRRSCGWRMRSGIPVLVDGSQGAVHMPVDVQDARLRLLRLHRPQDLRADRHRRALRQAEWLEAMPPFNGGGEMIRDVTRTRSPMATRRIASRPARRRSSRRSGSAPRSTT